MYRMNRLSVILTIAMFFLILSIFADDQTNDGEDITKIKAYNEIYKEEINLLKQKISKLDAENKDLRIYRLLNDVSWDVQDIRGLKFKNKIDYQVLSENDFKSLLEKKIDEEYPPDTAVTEEKVMKILGAFPEDFEYKKYFISIMLEQAAGVYDEDTKKIYVIEKFNFSENLSKFIFSHELTHALQDQTFNVKSVGIKNENNDDAAFAALCIIEGDAVMVMNEYLMSKMMYSMIKDIPSLMMMDQSQLQSAPPFLMNILLTPYLQGAVFVQYVEMNRPGDARNDLFRNPPKSSEQILHPEKYILNDDNPTSVTIPDLSEFLGENWSKTYSNVMGEIGVSGILRSINDIKFEDAADGWDGDRLEYYQDGDEKYCLLWESVWDQDEDADEFYSEISKYISKRFELDKDSSKNLFEDKKDIRGISAVTSDTKNKIAISISGSRVLLIISSDNIDMEKITENIFENKIILVQ